MNLASAFTAARGMGAEFTDGTAALVTAAETEFVASSSRPEIAAASAAASSAGGDVTDSGAASDAPSAAASTSLTAPGDVALYMSASAVVVTVDAGVDKALSEAADARVHGCNNLGWL